MAQETTPRRRVAAAVERWGSEETIRRCVAVLGGAVDADLAELLGGTSAPAVLAGQEGGLEGRWPRTWAARAFLYVWDPGAEPALLAAHRDPEWRVREMVAKVVAARQLGSPAAGAAALRLSTDEHARVRAAGHRALA